MIKKVDKEECMNQAIFIPRDVFKVAAKGLIISGELTSGTLKKGMMADINNQKVKICGIESRTKNLEEVKDTDLAAKILGISIEATDVKIVPKQPIIFKESQ